MRENKHGERDPDKLIEVTESELYWAEAMWPTGRRTPATEEDPKDDTE